MINSILTSKQGKSVEPKNSPLGRAYLEDLSDLPLIPLPNELKQLPPLPKEQEEVMRVLVRHAIKRFLEQYGNDDLQNPKKGNTVEDVDG